MFKFMKTMKFFLLFGAIALVFISCSGNDATDPDAPQAKTPIRLSSSVSLLRSGSQNQQIVNGQEVGFFLNETSETVFNINNEKLTADGSGNFAHSQMYYPMEGSSFVFSAYHPYSVTGLVDGYIEFSIASDQSNKPAYLGSDLLYSKKTGVLRTLNAVSLAFDHKLSRITFTIKKSTGVEIDKLSKIELLEISPSVKMDITDGTLSAASGTPITVNAFGVEGGESGVETLDGSAVIIVPQTIPNDSKLLLITIGDVVYSYTTTAEQVFVGGKSYDYQIEISAAEVNVTSSVNNWDTGDVIIGGGVME